MPSIENVSERHIALYVGGKRLNVVPGATVSLKPAELAKLQDEAKTNKALDAVLKNKKMLVITDDPAPKAEPKTNSTTK